MGEVINVYRIDYERGKGEDAQIWTAFIAGYSSEEAVKYLVNFYGGTNMKINTLGLECRLDAITNELRAKITDIPKPKPGRPTGSKTKVTEDTSVKYTKTEEVPSKAPSKTLGKAPAAKKSIIKK